MKKNRKSSWPLTKLHPASVAPDFVANIPFEAGGSRGVGQVADVIRCDLSLHQLFRNRHLTTKETILGLVLVERQCQLIYFHSVF